MESTDAATAGVTRPRTAPEDGHPFSWILVTLLIYLLLVAVAMIGGGFNMAAGENARSLFNFARNPLTGLVIGTVATALIQSSSTVTSIIVALVAGGLPVTIAIPMVMGANIGTTITNTIVSLGHIRRGVEFRRAYAAATIHDFFNLLSVLIFLPLEIKFGLLAKIGGWLSSLVYGGGSMSLKGLDFIKPLVKPVVHAVQSGAAELLPGPMDGLALVFLGVIAIIGVITLIGRLLKTLMVGRAKKVLHWAVGRGPLSGITSGTLLTVLVQSSSTTTSLIVPLAGSGVFTLRQIYPFTLGANIGTCITALLAATAITGPTATAALQIAFVHLTYNTLGVVVIYGIPVLRNIPIRLARLLALATVKNKMYAILYIGVVFFLAPALLILGSNAMGW